MSDKNRIRLGDDGTMDTVLVCNECGKEFRFTYQPEPDEADEADEAWVKSCIEEVEAEHVCEPADGEGTGYLHGPDDDNTPDPNPPTGVTNVEMFHVLQLKYALKLEIAGLRHSRGSVYAYVKKLYGFKGDKQSVLKQLCDKFGLEG